MGPGDPEYRAAILKYNPDGSGREVLASGIRNPVGMAWNPQSKELWATVQERDGLGDDLVPDFFTAIRPGAFYGWPYAYIGPNEEPRNKGQRPDLVAKTIVPDVVLTPAHVAVMDARFYTGKQVSGEVPQWRVRRAARLVEPGQAGRVLDRVHSVQERQALGRAGGLPHGLHDRSRREGSLGPSRSDCWSGRTARCCCPKTAEIRYTSLSTASRKLITVLLSVVTVAPVAAISVWSIGRTVDAAERSLCAMG